MTKLGRQDSDLHNEDGSHISTPASANGSLLETYERRIRRHLEAHAKQEDNWCAACGVAGHTDEDPHHRAEQPMTWAQPEMTEFFYRVMVTTHSQEAADQVMRERLYHDEDYGFGYTIEFAREGEDHLWGTDYPVTDWQLEVFNGDTELGYIEWAEHRREAERTNK